MMAAVPILHSILLLALANGAPVLAKKLFASRFALALDGGVLFLDGRPVFGASKTIRGIVASIVATAIGATGVGLSFEIGALVAILAMAGDLFSSFVKRRMNLPSSSQALGLDQIPESLFPLVVCREMLGLNYVDILLTVSLFFVGELALSRVLYVLRVRDQPY
ncbi:CDP-archaeol synthase [uncultured Bradyrhizobium sp.]|jgi:CDP-2,3-bis-(O-geranylgeranyl)-sn-glycerol synthase|uniref:CDP-archaeol synthase n=1 Tax=uncultured Bradyrhizobium sp. TaxID=199684 RepID=UPI00260EF852|nr:CDP-archaeol synthase [uncultured Bradyrhizobium sp.]